MADEIPLAYDKTTGGSPVGLKEIPPGNQLANQWLAMPAGYIEGLLIEWLSGSSIRVTSGACNVPGVATLTFPTAVTKSGLSLGSSAWGHVYAYINSGTPDIEISTTAPSAPYSGKARTKNGDTSRRYLGSILTDSNGAVIRFLHTEGQVTYNEGVTRNLSGGSATTFTAVSLSGQVPITSNLAIIAMTNQGTAAFRVRPVGYNNSINTRMYGITANSYVVGPLPLNNSQTYEYQVDSGSLGNVDLIGYYFSR